MAFKKGESGNPEGRPKGTGNKINNELRETIQNFLSNNFQQVTEDFKNLAPKDRAKLYCDLLQYGLPRLQASSLDVDFANMTEEQIDDLINKLLKKEYESEN